MRDERMGWMKKREKDNRGLTLIELLVAMTIVTIVIGVAFSFIIHTINLYRRGNNDSSVQNEAQLTMAQLESLVLNANMGIGLKPETDGKDVLQGNDLYLYYRDYEKTGYDESTDSATSTNVPYEAIHVYVDPAKGLSFCTRTCTYGSTTDAGGNTVNQMTMTADKANPEILSKFVKNVTDFTVDIKDLVKKNEITFTIKFEYQGRKYTSKNTIMLRNKIVSVNKDEAGDFFKVLDDTSKKNSTTAISVTNITDPALTSTAYVWAGGTYTNPFKAEHTFIDGSTGSGQTIWTLGSEIEGVTVNRQTGMLTIAENVTGSFTVYATSLSSVNADKDGTGTYVQGSATVYVKSVSNPILGGFSVDPLDSKIQKGKFTLTASNLLSSDIALIHPQATAGAVMKPEIGNGELSPEGTSLSYEVTLHRPVGYKGKKFPLTISCTVGGNTYEQSVEIEFLEGTTTPEDTFDGVYILATDGSGNSDSASENGNTVLSKVVRGDTGSFQLFARYTSNSGEPKTVLVSTNEWNLQSDNPLVAVNKAADGYTLNYNVGDYGQPVNVTLTSDYVNPDGNTVAGPTITLSFAKVNLSLNVNSPSQKLFPITRGQTQRVSFNVSGIKASSLCVLSEDSGLSTSISGEQVSVSATASVSSTKTVTFGLKDTKGSVLDGVSCDVRFYPGNANTYTYNGGKLTDSVYLPLATDISRFDSNVATPEADPDPIPVAIYTVDGESIVYTNRAEVTDDSNKGVDGKVHQYWAQYKGNVYYFDAQSRQWRLNQS